MSALKLNRIGSWRCWLKTQLTLSCVILCYLCVGGGIVNVVQMLGHGSCTILLYVSLVCFSSGYHCFWNAKGKITSEIIKWYINSVLKLLKELFLLSICMSVRAQTWPDCCSVYCSCGHRRGSPSVVANYRNVPRLVARQSDKCPV